MKGIRLLRELASDLQNVLYEYNIVKSHLEYKFKDLINHCIRMASRQTNFFTFNILTIILVLLT